MDNASQVLDKHFDNRVIKLPLVISGSRGWTGLAWAGLGSCSWGSLCGVKGKVVYYAICILLSHLIQELLWGI